MAFIVAVTSLWWSSTRRRWGDGTIKEVARMLNIAGLELDFSASEPEGHTPGINVEGHVQTLSEHMQTHSAKPPSWQTITIPF